MQVAIGMRCHSIPTRFTCLVRGIPKIDLAEFLEGVSCKPTLRTRERATAMIASVRNWVVS